MTKDIDNIKRVVTDIRYLIATDCCDETIQARIENYITEKQGQTLPIDSVLDTEGQLLAFSKFLLDRSYVRCRYYPETLVKLFKGK
jgi:hypothetical protein